MLAVCGDYVVPGKGTKLTDSDATAVVTSSRGTSREYHSNEIIFGVAFEDTITVTCTTANKLIGAASCFDKQLASITCQDDQMAFANWQDDMCEPCNVCGDEYLLQAVGEECDDGNMLNGDGCSSTCKVEICGNGVVDASEECDDGNTADCDGCSSCELDACGDGRLCASQNEDCDDGGTVGGDGCTSYCRIEICGNGVLDYGPSEPEEC